MLLTTFINENANAGMIIHCKQLARRAPVRNELLGTCVQCAAGRGSELRALQKVLLTAALAGNGSTAKVSV